MKNTKLFAILFWAVFLSLPFRANAATPFLTVTAQGNSNYQITVNAGNGNSGVDFYTREQGTDLWTIFHNLGQTSDNGYFSTSLMIGSFKSQVTRESYVVVGGQSSAIVTTDSSGQSGNLSFSPASANISQGGSATITVYDNPANQSLYIASNSSPSAVSAAPLGANSVSVYGIATGYATIQVCAGAGVYCGSFSVSVSGTPAGGLTFNPSSLSLNLNASGSVYVTGGGGQNLYLASNANPPVASVGINNQNSITVYASNTGSATVRLCTASSLVCGNLPVYVYSDTSNQGGLNFTSPHLPAGAVGSYYQAQVSASGGNPPYAYQVIAGTLPSGLSLGSNGMLQGMPTARAQYFFTVRATDYNGRQANQAFSVEIFSGSVLGGVTFQNGLIVQAGPTVYIVYKNTKTPFASQSAFEGLGFRFSQIACTSCGHIPDSGRTVRSAQAAHPWGAWVKNGPTVYFVQEAGLIPIASYDVFVGNGGQDYLVVPINAYDAGLPVLSVMTYNDARLR